MDPQTTIAASDSISQLIAGGGLVLSGGLILKLLELAQKVWLGKNQKTQVGPQPFEVKASADYALKSDCNGLHVKNEREHENIFARLSFCEQSLSGSNAKLDMLIKGVDRLEKKIDKI